MSIVLFNTDNDNFNNLLKNNNEEEIREYILKKGKKPKIICPICFYDKFKEEKKDADNN